MFFTLPNIEFEFSVGKYTAKICNTEKEYLKTTKLRYDIFYSDIKPPTLCEGYDFNKYDENSDIIILKDGDDIVGTYRMRCSTHTDSFYSTSSFILDELFTELKDRTIVELSRACIAPSKRQGGAIISLWRAVKHYLSLVKAEYLIGCVSIFEDSPEIAYGILKYLKDNNYYSDEYNIKPYDRYIKPEPKEILSDDKHIPALFSSYLKMGTRVYSKPAYDHIITGYDYFCMLNLKDFNPNYENKLT